jgi:hypothetical protein
MGSICSLRRIRRASAPAMRALAPCRLLACAAAAAMLLATPGYGADDFPPPISARSDQDAPAQGHPAPAPGGPAQSKSDAADGSLAAQPAAPRPERDVRIEQKHVGRRVSEVIVTPAGFTYHYTLIHLDDQTQGTTPLQPHPELSVPRFFRFDF